MEICNLFQLFIFFEDLFTDWSSSEPPDIAKFVPFDWAFNFNLRDFEIILMVNQHNWVECANEDENSKSVYFKFKQNFLLVLSCLKIPMNFFFLNMIYFLI